jgi:hypothetical protein
MELTINLTAEQINNQIAKEVRRCLVGVAGALKQIAERTPVHHQAEKKQQRFFEQKDSKASKVLVPVLKGSALRNHRLRCGAISENKPVDAVFQHRLVKVDQQT